MTERITPATDKEYGFLSEQPVYPVTLDHNGMPAQSRVEYRSLEEVEFRMVRDTIQLIEAIDGSDDDPTGKRYLHGERKFDGACEAAIYLDKSARPVRALVSEFWKDISTKDAPTASFLNIDKIDYLVEMGFSMRDIKDRHIELDEVSIEKIPPKDRLLRCAEIRALYFSDRSLLADAETLIEGVRNDTLPVDTLRSLWDNETTLDGKYVAIIDEVRSSGATLAIAEQLLADAFPEAKFEPLFWSTPPVHHYSVVDQDGRQVQRLADTEKPLWYDGATSAGRGGIGGKNPEYSEHSPRVAQRVGRFVLGVPFHIQNNEKRDTLGSALRDDIKKLASKWRAGKVKPPSTRRR